MDVDTARTTWEGDALVVRATADLNSAAVGRMLSLIVDDSMSYTLDMPLRPKPREADRQWTERMPLRLSTVTGTVYTNTALTARYRVVEARENGE